MSFTLAVKRSWIGQHFLTVPNCGPENILHSHHYHVEVQLIAATLDRHGYVTDITEVEAAMDQQKEYYRDQTLNELPEFEGLNPSIEHLSRIIAQTLSSQLTTDHLSQLSVCIWEDDIAWVKYDLTL